MLLLANCISDICNLFSISPNLATHSLTMYYHTIRYILIELVILPPDNANVVVAEDDRVFDIVPRFVTAAHRSSGAEGVPGIISSYLISVSGSLYSFE